ncbi:MAG: hypothetical protein ACK6DB_09100 [Planctomycetota bacterium]
MTSDQLQFIPSRNPVRCWFISTNIAPSLSITACPSRPVHRSLGCGVGIPNLSGLSDKRGFNKLTSSWLVCGTGR